MSEAKVYVVVGGSNSGVYEQSPHLSAASGSPILPIVIKCKTHQEAKTAAGLHAVFEQLGSETAQDNPQDFAKAIANSNHISPLFPSGAPFYAVYVGKNERAIYLKFSDFEHQVHGQFSPKYAHFRSIKQALVYMVLQGNEGQMKRLGLYGGLTFLVMHSKLTPVVDNPSTSVSAGEPPRSTPRPIFSHIRDFAGITGTIYGSTSGSPAYTQYDQLGKHAAHYLQAHGYTAETIEEIQSIWLSCKDVDEFVGLLNYVALGFYPP
ncbi:hypothetical protein B0H11DRAFT_1929744 [Mycena galericulata]|nr:hypothetical protein B0H11DRAFT_1929744 [Mycena galericulata]